MKKVAGRRWPCASLLLSAVAAIAYFVPGITEAWVLESKGTLNEAWRFLTCHWVHWSGEHLFWSGGAFFVLSAAAEDIGRRLYLACVLVSALLIPIGLRLWSPELAVYGGLSGIDSALFGLVAVSIVRDSISSRRWTGAVAIGLLSAGFAAKIGFETITGGAFFVNSTATMVPVPLAHLLGAAAGVVVGLAKEICTRSSSNGQTILERSAVISCSSQMIIRTANIEHSAILCRVHRQLKSSEMS
jgi:rhomboid family GlyGly-CTERM serine protease